MSTQLNLEKLILSRNQAGLSTESASKMLGMTEDDVKRIESGTRTISEHEIDVFVSVYKINKKWLFDTAPYKDNWRKEVQAAARNLSQSDPSELEDLMRFLSSVKKA